MVTISQEKLWIMASLVTIVAIVSACIVGAYFSTVGATPIFGFGAIIAGIVFQTMRQEVAAIRADNNAKIAAVKVEAATAMIQESAVQTEMKLAKIAQVTLDTNKTGEKVHILVNSNMAKALKAVAAALRTVAALRPSPENEAAAKEAEETYAEHEKKQGMVDGKDAKDAKDAKEGTT